MAEQKKIPSGLSEEYESLARGFRQELDDLFNAVEFIVDRLMRKKKVRRVRFEKCQTLFGKLFSNTIGIQTRLKKLKGDIDAMRGVEAAIKYFAIQESAEAVILVVKDLVEHGAENKHFKELNLNSDIISFYHVMEELEKEFPDNPKSKPAKK